MAVRASPGSLKSRRSTPPTTRASSPSALSTELRMASVSRPAALGRAPHSCSTWARAASSETRRPPGSRPGRVPASIPPRSPARRGTQARRAPVLLAKASTALSRPGTSAARSPTRMVAPSALRASVSSAGRALTAATSLPGVALMMLARSFTEPALLIGATVCTLRPRLFTALCRRRNSEPHSSSGSRATSSTVPALSRLV